MELKQGDCIELMKGMETDSIGLIVTSPPYNVGIEYDSWNDRMDIADYRMPEQKAPISWIGDECECL